MRLSRAIDLYIGELARRGRSKKTRNTYERQLIDFAKLVDRDHDLNVDEISADECRRHLDRWRDDSPSTQALGVSILRGFFTFLEQEEKIEPGRNPTRNIRRPKRLRPEDLPVVTVSSSDTAKLVGACRDFQELLCLGAAAYTGRRRTALANARRSDADLEHGYLRFTDKGGKVIHQPIPEEFLAVLREAEQHNVWAGPDDYLIPNRRRATTNQQGRSSKIIYETVKKVGERAGVKIHVHALRAAFAVHFLESKPDRIYSLKELMGHDRIETTMVYLRRMNRAQAMEDVRDLSWSRASVLSECALEAHTGFEPVSGPSPPRQREAALPEPLKSKLAELRAAQRGKARDRRR